MTECKAKKNRFTDVSWRGNSKYEVLEIAKKMVKSNHSISLLLEQ